MATKRYGSILFWGITIYVDEIFRFSTLQLYIVIISWSFSIILKWILNLYKSYNTITSKNL